MYTMCSRYCILATGTSPRHVLLNAGMFSAVPFVKLRSWVSTPTFSQELPDANRFFYVGFHQETAVGPLPELEREIRRRIWCVLDTWDW